MSLSHTRERLKARDLFLSQRTTAVDKQIFRCIITPVKEKLITTKITPKALRLLRLIAALTGERQYRALERLLEREYARLIESKG